MYEVDGLPPKSLCEIDFIYDENGVAVHDLWSSLNNLCKKVGE